MSRAPDTMVRVREHWNEEVQLDKSVPCLKRNEDSDCFETAIWKQALGLLLFLVRERRV